MARRMWEAMRIRPLLIPVFACCALPFACSAQSALTPQSIQTQLKGQLLMLRGRYDGVKLKFDAQGRLEGQASLLPFGLSAVHVDDVRVTDTQVQIEATRDGLEFARKPGESGVDAAHAVPWGPSHGVKILITWNAAQPEQLRAAIGKIFSADLGAGMARDAPPYWQPWLLSRMNNQKSAVVGSTYPGIEVPGAGVTDPELRRFVEPKFSDAARRLNYSGTVDLGLVVDPSGLPQDIHIVRPLGMGLDEQAVAAVQQYRFKPARDHGKPVPVQIVVEVNFRTGEW